MGLGLRRRLESACASWPPARRLMTAVVLAGADWLPRHRHPFDKAHGVRTQARLPLYLSRSGSAVDEHSMPYAGCVPSVLRQILTRYSDEDLRQASFMDLGCGKGRALVVACERPFRRIVGVELNPDIAEAARRNARRVRRVYPGRTPIEVETGDASQPSLPDGPLIVFLYHPFGEALVVRLREHLAAHAGAVTVIYENPVHGAVFDADPAFERCFAAMMPVAPEEAEFCFEPDEGIAIWELRPAGPSSRPVVGADARITIVDSGFRALVVKIN